LPSDFSSWINFKNPILHKQQKKEWLINYTTARSSVQVKKYFQLDSGAKAAAEIKGLMIIPGFRITPNTG